jgi:hypothetical protein
MVAADSTFPDWAIPPGPAERFKPTYRPDEVRAAVAWGQSGFLDVVAVLNTMAFAAETEAEAEAVRRVAVSLLRVLRLTGMGEAEMTAAVTDRALVLSDVLHPMPAPPPGLAVVR